MTEYIDYEMIKDELNTEWNVAIIAKPAFQNARDDSSLRHSTVNIDVFKSDAGNSHINGDKIQTPFTIVPVAESKANADLYLGEIRRIINTKSGGSSIWHIDTWIFRKMGALRYYECEGSERQLDSYV